MRSLLGALAMVAVAGCYNPSVDPCRITCADDVPCPGSYECGADGRCHVAGDTQACELDDPDAGVAAGQFKALAVGEEFTCAIGADDELYCWGNNFVGALGDGTFTTRATPGVIDEPGPWRSVAAGPYHACAIKQSGALFCWGSNDFGEVDGTSGDSEARPQEVEHPTDATFVDVDLGEFHTCAIDSDANLVCWGANDFGQLGFTAEVGVFEPAVIAGHTDWVEVAASDVATCARKTDGRSYCWGRGPIGQALQAPDVPEQRDVPTELVDGPRLRSISVGRSHACGVTMAGALLCWGDDDLFATGDAGDSAVPAPAHEETDFVEVFAGRWTTCAARSSTDDVVCFGDNREGQLGTGERTTFDELELTLGGRVIHADTGAFFTCLLDATGTISCMGRDDFGQCGDGVIDDRALDPSRPVEGFGDETIVEISGRFWHVCARSQSGRLWCWGSNFGGAVGDGEDADRATPYEIPQQDGAPWIAVTTGAAHTCAVADATPLNLVYCWGNDDAGQLGNGTTPGQRTPVPTTATGADFTDIGGGAGYSCAIDSNSERWCWGDNSVSDLGAGTVVPGPTQDRPIQLDNGPAGWLEIEGGFQYGCGIGADGTLWCWGSNLNGRLGVGPTPDESDVPLPVGGALDWKQLAADAQYGSTCGIRDDGVDGGQLYCWGINDNYQLGTGDQTAYDTPQPIGTEQWLRIDLGGHFACGLDASAELFCWGSNDSLQSALGAARDHVSSIPAVSMWPGTVIDAIETGYYHACAIEGGDVFCWGDGGYGQLGNGNRAAMTPRAVIAP